MIIKIKKRSLIIAGIAFLVLIVPFAFAQTLLGFGVEVWVGNEAPIVIFDPGTSTTLSGTSPSIGGIRLVWFVFNVTDGNGEDDILESSARFNLTLGTPGFAQWRWNKTCTNISKIPGDNKVIFNCSVYMQYFDNASNNWVLNMTVFDSVTSSRDDTQTFDYSELSSLSFPIAWINFTSLTQGDTNKPAGGAKLTLNNTGNDDFTQINITAADLIGGDFTVFGIGNFTANYTNAVDTGGMTLNKSGQTFIKDGSNLLLSHGHTRASTDYNDGVIADKGNQSLFFWVDVPLTGLTTDEKYNNTWNITVFDIP